MLFTFLKENDSRALAIGINQIANGMFACAAIAAATALVITGHTEESFWRWPLYGWLYGLGVFAIVI